MNSLASSSLISQFTSAPHVPMVTGLPKAEREKLTALASTSRVCKTFHRVVAEQLYRTIHVPYAGRDYLPIILRTLVGDPRLAKLVKQIHAHGWNTRRRQKGRWAIEPTKAWEDPPWLNKCSRAAIKANLSKRTRLTLLDDFKDNHFDAQLALLLILCPNLELLDYIPVEIDECLVSRLLNEGCTTRKAKDGPVLPKFAHLRELRIQHHTAESMIDMEFPCDMMRLPTLEIFRGNGLDLFNSTATPRQEPIPGHLKELYLQNSVVDGEAFNQILVLFPILINLEIVWTEHRDPWLDFDHMGRALRRCGRQLRSLKLDPRLSPDYASGGMVRGRIGSLEDLAGLRELTIPLQMLVIWFGAPVLAPLNLVEALPDSIEKLLFLPTNP